jgi:hypothetical protein
MLIKKRYLILKTFRVEGYYDCVDTEYYETTHKMRMYTNEFCSSLLQGNYLEGNVDLSSGRIEMYDAVEFGLAFTYDNNIDVIYMYLDFESLIQNGILREVPLEDDVKLNKKEAYDMAQQTMEVTKFVLHTGLSQEMIDYYVKQIILCIHAQADYIIDNL